ncbi:MAG: hypothetical protein BJ554DRAFT_7514 [Olpidium bornovanus]|uniref:Uncharacterized protein n=1 Tax=Olpidium bornovanus TaxID=278681 RepID=A0A8H7ZVV2_9FUNG|nr:MAG: hypothetical protein BJ554DRAFT_7514 [Olpidium bornovanus]
MSRQNPIRDKKWAYPSKGKHLFPVYRWTKSSRVIEVDDSGSDAEEAVTSTAPTSTPAPDRDVDDASAPVTPGPTTNDDGVATPPDADLDEADGDSGVPRASKSVGRDGEDGDDGDDGDEADQDDDGLEEDDEQPDDADADDGRNESGPYGEEAMMYDQETTPARGPLPDDTGSANRHDVMMDVDE